MKNIWMFLLFSCLSATIAAQGVKPLPTLHVEGKWLVDKHGNHVVLHGVMDTPSAWFNSGRWGWSYDNDGRQRCLNYFEKVFTGLEKAHCNVFRLHLEPAWTNDPSSTYKYAGSNGQSSDATGEADISKFNPSRLTNYLKTLYFPLAKKSMNHGMFVVMRPPGVCPKNLKVGDYYQKYLLEVWDIVSKNDSIQKYAGQISLELANEPVNLRNKYNQDDAKALRDYFQPIVDKIRENGFTGIIWIPGTGWQSNYTSYATYPVTGYNIGYAVHDYNGWYGCDDKNITNVTTAKNAKIVQFKKSVPVVTTNPIIITEVDWSPMKPGSGHYNEHGEWVESNYGTWATATTSKWGACFKGVLDYYKNISMTLSGTDCLIDVDQLLKDGSVVPAFEGEEEACGKACMDWYAEYWNVDWPHPDVQEGTPEYETAVSLQLSNTPGVVKVGNTFSPLLKATFQDTHVGDVTSSATLISDNTNVVQVNGSVLKAVGYGFAKILAKYKDSRDNEVETSFVIQTTFFPFTDEDVNANLSGTGVFNASSKAMRPSASGQIGWEYAQPADMSGYKYLVIKLRQAQTCNAHLNIYTSSNLDGDCFSSESFGSDKQIVINLKEAVYTSGSKQGQPLDTKNVSIVSFWGDGNGLIWFSDIYLTNSETFEREDATSVQKIISSVPSFVDVYSLSGQMIRRHVDRQQLKNELTPGLYIIEGRKVIVK